MKLFKIRNSNAFIVHYYIKGGRLMVITIARQFGSGGRKIGQQLAEKLDIAYYDKNLLTLVAKESGMDPDIIENLDEKATNSLLYSLSIGAAATLDNGFRIEPQMPLNDKLFLAQHDVIRKISSDPCVIVGRCADYVLRNREDCVRLFIYADIEKRVEYAVHEYGVNSKKAQTFVSRTDKSRANYYNYYSTRKWGDPNNYDLCIDSGKLGIDGTVELIISYLRQRGML